MTSKTKATATDEEGMPALVPKLRFPEFRGLENWSETNVGKISDTVTAGGTPSTSEKRFWGGEIRWMNSGELNDKQVSEVRGRITREGLNNSSTKVIPPRCVLIGLAGQGKTRGTVAMNLVELCINQSIAAIYPNSSAFNSNFLYHNLDKRYDELRRLSAGGEGRGGLNLQIIKSLKVALPSLPEQQKIAECLSSVDDLMTAQARKVAALKTHKKGLIQQLFPREGETHPRRRFPEFQNAGAWEVKSLGDICHYWNGGSNEGAITENGEYYLISLNSIDIDGNLKADMKRLSKTDHSLKKNDLIMVLSDVAHGNFLGLTDIIPNEMYVLNQRMAGLRLKNDSVGNVVFLRVFINKKQRYFKQKGQGSSQQNLAKSAVTEFPVVLPCQEEQQRIADCVTTVDALITAETQKHEALKTHKKGLMQQLFPSPEAVEV
jgi:type I restriction enzyme S subunit